MNRRVSLRQTGRRRLVRQRHREQQQTVLSLYGACESCWVTVEFFLPTAVLSDSKAEPRCKHLANIVTPTRQRLDRRHTSRERQDVTRII
jgi:hypothetical protein